MLLFHVTHWRNWQSIRWLGLRASFCVRRLPATWLCSFSRIGWVRQEVCRQHGWDDQDLIVLAVTIPRWKLLRYRIKGRWYTRGVVMPQQLRVFQAAANAPGEGLPYPICPW